MYIRGMGQANSCGAGYQPSASDPTVCESTATYSLGQTCFSNTFPFVGTIDSNVNCQPYPATYGFIAAAILALLLAKGGR